MKNWGSAAVSDLVIFNSEFHRSVFAEQAETFLNAFPDEKQNDLVSEVIEQSIVLPVGIDLSGLSGDRVPRSGPPLVVWNQRWEHDKGPAELHAIVAGLIDSGVEFEMAMCGEVFVSVPPEFGEITALLGNRLIHEGFAELHRYEELLLSASVVLSTAEQEFFGIGVIEGIASGAHPILPNRLVYLERIDALRADPASCLYDSTDEAVALIVKQLAIATDPTLRSTTLQFDWSEVAPAYDESLEALSVER
jgi:glycosyltransferase involved in cell wall biosynthesis